MSIAITGAKFISQSLQLAGKRMTDAMGGAVYKEASRIIAKSALLTPVDTGRLRASAFVSSPQRKGGDLTVTMGYGTDYAAAVHERHATKKKFLRIPFNDAKPRSRSNMAKDAAQLFREGKGFGNVAHEFPTKPKLSKSAARKAKKASEKDATDPK